MAALRRSPRGKGGHPPFDPVLIFKILVLQAALLVVGPLQSQIQRGPEYLEVDQGIQLLQRIACRRKRRIPCIQIKKATLQSHRVFQGVQPSSATC